MYLLLLVIYFKLYSHPLQLENSRDYRMYYLKSARIYADRNLDHQGKINQLKALGREYKKLLPNELRVIGAYYDSIGEVDSAKVYLTKANNLGANPHNADLIKKYKLIDITTSDTGYFAMHNQGKARMVKFIQSTDRAIRQKGRNYCAMEIIDSMNIQMILDQNLLAFSNSAYAQVEAWVVCMHAYKFYQRDPEGLKAYLLGLVKQGELHPEYYARLIDTYNIDVNGYQIYGTIGRVEENRLVLTRPFLEPERVDEYRLEIGFQPMDEWLESQDVEGYSEFVKYKK